MIVIASLFPLLLFFGGLLHGVEWQDSMSAYYYATVGDATPAMRVWFIGLLYALGAFLFLYKGFSKLEDWSLNFAGIFAVGVARFPMPWPAGSGSNLNIHYICAVLMFICVGIVTLFCTNQTLELVADPKKRKMFSIGYRIAGSSMVFLPIIFCLYNEFLPELAERSHQVFWLEAVCIWAFALYWFIKSWELRGSMAEIEALNMKLTTDSDPVSKHGRRVLSPARYK